jgi:hypothetical protein
MKIPIFINLNLGIGYGMKKRDQLISLWMLLIFVKEKEICQIWIVGDSKFVIDWFDGHSHLNNFLLDPFKRWIRDIQ